MDYLFNAREEVTKILYDYQRMIIRWILVTALLLLFAFALISIRGILPGVMFIFLMLGIGMMLSVSVMRIVRNSIGARKCSKMIDKISEEIKEHLK